MCMTHWGCVCFIWVQNFSDNWFIGFHSREEKSVIQMVGISFQPLHLKYAFNKMLNTMGIAQFCLMYLSGVQPYFHPFVKKIKTSRFNKLPG